MLRLAQTENKDLYK